MTQLPLRTSFIPVLVSSYDDKSRSYIAAVIPVFVNEFDDGFHQVILNEVKNLTISAHEILLPPERDQDD